MKKYLPIVAAVLAISAVSASAQNLKIGTVDMKKVFESYYKTKDAESHINEARASAKKELDDRMDVYNKGVAEAKKINDEIEKLDKAEISKETKAQKAKLRDEKVAELGTMQREINEFRTTREKQLQEQSARMRNGIVDEIKKIVDDRVKVENYNLVFDKSGLTLNGVTALLYSKDEYEFTNDVITALNKNKGKDEAAAAAAAPAATPDKTQPPAATPKKRP